MPPAAALAAVQGEEEAQDGERRIDFQGEEAETAFALRSGQLAFGTGALGALALGPLGQGLLPDFFQQGDQGLDLRTAGPQHGLQHPPVPQQSLQFHALATTTGRDSHSRSIPQQGYYATLNNCRVAGNWAHRYGGGGAGGGILNNCTLTGNSTSGRGGGASGSELLNCTLTGNSATDSGGGAFDSSLNNCTLSGNSASNGGGASQAALNNCTLTGNSAAGSGGGAARSTLNNCIVYLNTSPDGANCSYSIFNSCTLNYCCTTPLPAEGTGNIALDPQLASASHLSAASPCRGAGNADYVSGTDLDGEAWATPPSIGCDEYHPRSVTGMLSVNILSSYTNVAAGFAVELTALITGRTSASTWNFGDGTTVSNRPYASHLWATPGDYPVVLRAYNDSYPTGVTATLTVHVVGDRGDEHPGCGGCVRCGGAFLGRGSSSAMEFISPAAGRLGRAFRLTAW